MATAACQDLAQRLRIVVAYEPADMASAACDILSEAIRLHGAFAGSEYAELRATILHPPSECPSDMQLGEPCHAYAAGRPKAIAWDRVAGLLAAGELAELRTKDDVWRLQSWVTACHTAADAIEREAEDGEDSATVDNKADKSKGSRKSRKGVGGTKPVSSDEEKKRLDILRDWWQAHDAGIKQKQFCRDAKITTQELRLYVDWYGHRKSRETN